MREAMAAEAVVVLSGRRPSENEGPQLFPSAEIPRVRTDILKILIEENAVAIVCSAAAGADLIALKEAQRIGVRTEIILPSTPSDFRRNSVADKGPDWVHLFDEVLQEAQRHGTIRVSPPKGGGSDQYLHIAHVLLSRARDVATSQGATVIAVAVWDGASHTGVDVTAAFLAEARGMGIAVREVRTTGSS